jgi:hypothetical protein
MVTVDNIENDTSKMIVIGGKTQTIADAQKAHAEFDIVSTQGATKLIAVMSNATEPLTRDQIADKSKLSLVYVISILENLKKYDYIASFHIGANKKRLYYALTVNGYKNLCKKETNPE